MTKQGVRIPIALFWLLSVPGSLWPQNRGDTATSYSPFVKLKSVDLGDARWTRGFWFNKFELCRNVMVHRMWEVLQRPGNGALFTNLRIAAGLQKGEFQGKNWSDGDVYKWLEAVAHVYAITREEKLDRLMDDVIAVIGKAQAPDGYISTQIQLTGRKRWERPGNHELYNMGHLMTAACVHHRATGKRNFLEIAIRLADYLYNVFQPRPVELAHFGFNPSNIMGVADLYRTTRNPKYLELAGIFVDMRGSAPGGSDLNQARVPLRKETESVGHAVTGIYLYAGATDVYGETGEQALWDALERIWRDVTAQKMCITGGVGAIHYGRSSRQDPVHEAFGTEYQLPNRLAYNETCANIANAMWNWRLLGVTGDASYADVMERVLYNSMLSGVGVNGTEFFYTNVLRRYGAEMPMMRNDSLQRWTDNTKTPYGFCCPPSVVRTIAKVHEWAYSVSRNAVWVNLYGSNLLKTRLPGGTSVVLAQRTDYPWDGKIGVTVQEAGSEPLDIMLRIPAWADGATVQVNGQPVADSAPRPGTYCRVSRLWRAGDRIDLALPMKPRLVVANPLVEELRGQAAVERGPIVYCLESPDLPEGVRVEHVALPADIRLEPRHEPSLLGGITVLEGEARYWQDGNWAGLLYRFLSPARYHPLRIRLIPYYAWANRGVSHMTVWMSLVQ
ncbi:MAG: glycoside hydrolase family 127 protein [Acidobacteria bacterium]|nr:glycoside hydrolase family 127 protein [Acidobacteriota bacterium]